MNNPASRARAALMTDPTFTDALEGATLPALGTCHLETGHAGRFLVWSLGFDVPAHLLDVKVPAYLYATPGWEGHDISINILHTGTDGAIETQYLDTKRWPLISTDGVEDAHRYLAAMRSWYRQLPKLHVHWDGDKSTEWTGNVVDLLRDYGDTLLFNITDDWFGTVPADRTEHGLLDILQSWSDAGRSYAAAATDNVVVRMLP